MKKIVLLVVLLMVLAVSVQATPWTTYLTVAGAPNPMLKVVASAVYAPETSVWTWGYDVTAIDIKPYPDGVKGFSINLGSPEAGLASNITTTAAGWVGYQSSTQVYWQLSNPSNGLQRLNTGQTFHFQFDHPWGPLEWSDASAQDTYGFFGPVAGPAVPEPMSIMLGALGLGAVSGFRRLRRK